MFFDTHADILPDVMEQNRLGIDIWNDYHMPKYKKGKLLGSIFVNYTNPNSETQKEDFKEINKVSLEYFKNRQDIKIIYKSNDFDFNTFNLILGIEGLNAIDNVDQLDDLFNLGYRHFSLTWNEKNQFAAGSIQEGGLTDEGEKLIKKAEQLGFIVDLAHLNEESFFDAIKIISKPIFVSHANVKALCDHPRNLSNIQLQKLKESNGVIGLSVMAPFLNKDKEKASIYDFINNVKYIKELIGIDHVGFGFDFCHYLKSHNEKNPVEGLNQIDDILQIPKLLKEEGLTDDEIKKVCYKNMLRVINEHLE